MTKTYLTLNGHPIGFLTPREEEILAAGRVAALADLHTKVTALLKDAERMEWERDAWLAMAYRDVLALINERSHA